MRPGAHRAKVKTLFALFVRYSSNPPPPSPTSLSVSSRHWEALTLINGEPGSALKARRGQWGQIKVEHRSGGRGKGERGPGGVGGRGGAGHSHQSLSASPSRGDSAGRGGWRGQRRLVGPGLSDTLSAAAPRTNCHSCTDTRHRWRPAGGTLRWVGVLHSS